MVATTLPCPLICAWHFQPYVRACALAMAGLVLVAQPFATALASDDERASTEIVFDADSARDPRLELVTPIAGSVEFTPDGMLLASQRNKQPSGVAAARSRAWQWAT